MCGLMRRFIGLWIGMMMGLLAVQAQLQISAHVRNPLPPQWVEWERSPDLLLVNIYNPTGRDIAGATIRFSLAYGGRQILSTRPNARLPRFTFPSGEVVTIRAEEAGFTAAMLDYDEAMLRDVVRSGCLPAGTYHLCITIYDANGGQVGHTDPCITLSIQWPTPPVAIYPLEGTRYPAGSYPRFVWRPVYNAPPQLGIQYRLRIAPLRDGLTPREAIEDVPLLDRLIETPYYQYQPSDPPLRDGQKYVWRVEAFTEKEEPLQTCGSRMNGSEIRQFVIGDVVPPDTVKSGKRMHLWAHWPLDGDTIPWRHPLLVIRFGPYSDQLRGVIFTVEVEGMGRSGRVVLSNRRTLRWPRGPIRSQGLSHGDTDRAVLHILTHVDDAGHPLDWSSQLERGRQYRWRVEARFQWADGSESVARLPWHAFTLGLRKPQRRFPADGEVYPIGADVPLEWQVPPPQALNFSPPDLLSVIRRQTIINFPWAHERMQLEVAADADFRHVVWRRTVQVPTTDLCRQGDACADLFVRKEAIMNDVDSSGTYYWRVKYLHDGVDTAYSVGPVWRFEVREEVGDTVSAAECVRMRGLSPVGRETRTSPTFSVTVTPRVRREGIRGGILRIWRSDSVGINPSVLMRRPPVHQFRFSDASDFELMAYAADVHRLSLTSLNRRGAPHRFEPRAGGAYVWQLVLYVDSLTVREDGVRCHQDSLVMDPVVFSYLPYTERCSGCADAMLPTDQTPASDRIRRGDTLQIGSYQMVVTSVRGRPSNLRGEGFIYVRFFRGMPLVKVAVEFDGIKVNAAHQVYEGVVHTQWADMPLKERLRDVIQTGGELLESEIHQLHEWFDGDPLRRLSDRMASLPPIDLPIGVDEQVDGRHITIGIVGIRWTPQRAELTATTWVEIPELFSAGQGLGLTAGRVCLLPATGISTNRWLLGLAGDISLGAKTFKQWQPGTDSGSYVEMYCGGIRVIQLEVEERIGRDVLLPIGPDGKPIDDPNRFVHLRYTARWQSRTSGTGSGVIFEGALNEAAIAANPEFKLRGVDGGIRVMVDRSLIANPPGFAPPPEYAVDSMGTQWMGVYLPRAAIEMPAFWSGPDGTVPRLELQNALVDGSLSFTLEATGILHSISLAQWGGSVDTVRLAMLRGSLREASVKGRLWIPVSDSALHYQALYARADTDSLVLTVDPRGMMNFPLTDVGQLILDPSSTIGVEVVGGKLRQMNAFLNGTITIAGAVGEIPGLDFRGIRFERFGWVTDVTEHSDGTKSYAHRFNRGAWSLASPAHGVAGFPVGVEDIDIVGPLVVGSGLEAGLQITLSAQLVENLGDAGTGIGGSTTLSLWGQVAWDASEGRLRPRFDRVQLDTIYLSADLGAARINGKFWLYANDAVYGNGFRGEVQASVMELAEGEAVAQFGRKGRGDGSFFSYWYVDAALRFPTGIAAGPIAFYGFGGGAWYHMRVDPKPSCEAPSVTRVAGANPGASASCYRFVPDEDGAFGVKAMTTLGLPGDPRPFNADAELSATFNGRTGGLERAQFAGDMWMMAEGRTALEGLSQHGRNQAPLWGASRMTFTYVGTEDGRAPVFDGTFSINLAVPRSSCVVCGEGELFIHFGPDDWYIWVGRPWSSGAPVGVTLQIGDIRLAQVASYLQLGSRLDPPPPMPPEVVAITGGRAKHSLRMPALFSTGGGAAFGQQLDFNTGRLEFLVFYGRLRLLTGYDVTLRRVTEGISCAGVLPPIGMNGWYGMGQVYAYAAADLGMHVDVWFYEGDVEILSCEAGAALQAGLPNPTWLKGAVGGRFSALGGLVEGNVNFRFTVGTECRPPVSGPLSMPLISDMSPTNGDRGVDVMVAPQAAFTFSIGEPFEVEEYVEGSDEPVIRRFRVVLDEVYLRESGRTVRGTWTLESPDLVVFEPHDMLKGHTRYEWGVRVRGEEYDFSTGRWVVAQDAGRPVSQTKEVEFVTGDAPQVILPSNIAAMYPQDGQRYVLPGEMAEGFIALRRGMPDLLAPSDRVVKVRVVDAGGMEHIVTAHYDALRRRLEFPLEGLQTNQMYLLEVLSVARRSLGDVVQSDRFGDVLADHRMVVIREQVLADQPVYLRRKVLPHQRYRAGERRLYYHYFATSQYQTLADKVNALFGGRRAHLICGQECLGLEVTVENPPEWFDQYDISQSLFGGSGVFGVRGNIRTALARRGGWYRRIYNRIYRYIETDPWRRLLGWRVRSSPFTSHRLVITPVERPLSEMEIRRAFGDRGIALSGASASIWEGGVLPAGLEGGLGVQHPTYRIMSLCFLDIIMDGLALRHRIARVLREDVFIRSFEQQVGHAWSPNNEKRRMRLITVELTGVSDHLGHFHSFDELGLDAAHFPRILDRPLSGSERRRLQRALRQLNEPLVVPSFIRRVGFDFWYRRAAAYRFGDMFYDLLWTPAPATIEFETAP